MTRGSRFRTRPGGRPVRIWLAAGLFAFALVRIPAAVAAAPTPSAPVLHRFNLFVEKAFVARDTADHGAAVEAFDQALRTIRDRVGPAYRKARTGAMDHKALSLMALQRHEAAKAVLETLLNIPGLAAKDRDVIHAKLGEIQRTLEEARAQRKPVRVEIAVVDARGSPLAAQVSLRDSPVGRAPVAVTRPPGTHVVSVRLLGFRRARRDLVVRAGEPARLELKLQRLPPTPRGNQAAEWVLGGVGLAAVFAGAVLHGVGASDREAANDGDLLWTDAQARESDAETKLTAAYVLYGIGGAAMVTSIILLVTGGSSQPPGSGAHVSPTMVPAGAGVSVRLGF